MLGLGLLCLPRQVLIQFSQIVNKPRSRKNYWTLGSGGVSGSQSSKAAAKYELVLLPLKPPLLHFLFSFNFNHRRRNHHPFIHSSDQPTTYTLSVCSLRLNGYCNTHHHEILPPPGTTIAQEYAKVYPAGTRTSYVSTIGKVTSELMRSVATPAHRTRQMLYLHCTCSSYEVDTLASTLHYTLNNDEEAVVVVRVDSFRLDYCLTDWMMGQTMEEELLWFVTHPPLAPEAKVRNPTRVITQLIFNEWW